MHSVRADQGSHKTLLYRRRPVPMAGMGPGLRGCNPIGLHHPFATNFAIPAQAGTHSAADVKLSDGTRSQKRSNSGACGSMGPGRRGCNPIRLHRPFATNYAIPAQAGTHSAAGVELSDVTRSRKRSGACGSVEANWVTASV